jgi:hypothetical protein
MKHEWLQFCPAFPNQAALRDFQTDAVKASEAHTKNGLLMGKLDKLIAAGAIQV